MKYEDLQERFQNKLFLVFIRNLVKLACLFFKGDFWLLEVEKNEKFSLSRLLNKFVKKKT